MEYQGTTITEAGLFDVLLIGVVAIISTYPLSLVLMYLGLMKKSRHGVIFRANEIAKNQMPTSFMAWIVGAALCYVALIGWSLILGVLVWVGIAEPVRSLISDPFIFVCVIIHVLCQGYAYKIAIDETQYLVD